MTKVSESVSREEFEALQKEHREMQKQLKTMGKPKKQKDPNAPKKARSAYTFFVQDKRESIKTEDPTLSFGDLSRKLGSIWSEMTDEQKAPFSKKQEEDKKRFLKEVSK